MAETSRPATPTDRPVPPSRPRDPLWRWVVGDCLRHTRHERGETLDGVADRAGVSPQYLSEIERGLKEPSSEVIGAVTRALGLSLADLTLAVAETLAAPRPSTRAPSCRAELALAA